MLYFYLGPPGGTGINYADVLPTFVAEPSLVTAMDRCAHFSNATYGPAGVERFSAYRFFDAEVVGVDDGGVLGWDNGCAGYYG